jgi:hypothetical protein
MFPDRSLSVAAAHEVPTSQRGTCVPLSLSGAECAAGAQSKSSRVELALNRRVSGGVESTQCRVHANFGQHIISPEPTPRWRFEWHGKLKAPCRVMTWLSLWWLELSSRTQVFVCHNGGVTTLTSLPPVDSCVRGLSLTLSLASILLYSLILG